jgi:adenosylhomocysteinase
MDGFRVMTMDEAAPLGDMFVTLTGDIRVITRRHFEAMKDGAVVANSGHFDVEIDKDALRQMAVKTSAPRDLVETFVLKDGRKINLLGEGRLINLAAAEGHPASVMDMSFANQALCCEYLAGLGERLPVGVHPVPSEIDKGVARLKLEAMGIAIDTLTPEQIEYLSSWKLGT